MRVRYDFECDHAPVFVGEREPIPVQCPECGAPWTIATIVHPTGEE